MMRQRRFTLSAKFMLGLGVILLAGISVFSFLTYDYLKEMYIREAYEKTDIVLGHIDATMEYARDELRPQIFHVLPGNIFIRQVMSSSFMNRGIMRRFTKKFPRYIYRRVAIDPMNPEKKADAFEEGFVKRFQKEPPAKQRWRGLVTRDGKEYFLQVKGIVMEKQCLLCHGDPANSPPSINRHYGTVHGRHWKVGRVVGLESIAAPVSAAFQRLRHVAFFFFLFGVLGVAMLFAVLNYFHYRVAVVPLKRVSAFFREVVNRRRGLDIQLDDVRDYEEVSDMAESFNRMMGYLKKSEEERKKMEERMRQAEKLASIGQLAAGVAHEINNPLSVILGYTKMLRKECPDQGRAKEDLDMVYTNARTCKRIVEDLLNFSRQTKARRFPTDVNGSVEAAAVALEEEFRNRGLSIVRAYDPSLPWVVADEEKLRRVFTNLLTNSMQAMSQGSVTIRTEQDHEKNGVKVTITDTGSGIPEKVRDKIFEPFFTTKPPGQGTGLGLAVSYGIVKEHKGEISVESEEGKGTSFTLWLPLEGKET